MSKTIDDLLAEAQIKDVHLRFCRANDRRDEELMRSCFHPDAVIELHETLDVEAFLALGRAVLSRFTVTWHNTGNQLVEVNGDTAWAEHYTISSHRIAADETGAFVKQFVIGDDAEIDGPLPCRDFIINADDGVKMSRAMNGNPHHSVGGSSQTMVVGMALKDDVVVGGGMAGTGGSAGLFGFADIHGIEPTDISTDMSGY